MSKDYNNIRARGENDRTPEFRQARVALLHTADAMFEDLENAKKMQNRQFKFGSAVFGVLGVKRDVLKGVSRNLNHLIESTNTSVGLFVATDPQNGHDVILLNRPDKSRVEIRRNQLLQSVVLPENPLQKWDPRPGGVSNRDILISINETQKDGGSVGCDVTADGSVLLHKKDPGRKGMHYTQDIAPHDASTVETALLLLNSAKQDLFIDTA